MTSNLISWQQLIGHIEQVVKNVQAPDDIDRHKEELLEKLEQYLSNYIDFDKFVHYDSKGFTKNLVADFGNICNVIIMCWAPGQMSSIHSHNGSKCFVKILKGQLDELRLTCPNSANPIVQIDVCNQEASKLDLNNVTYIDDSIGAHKVINKSNRESAISLHVYVPAYKTTRVYTPIGCGQGGLTKLSLDHCRAIDLEFYNNNDNNDDVIISQ